MIQVDHNQRNNITPKPLGQERKRNSLLDLISEGKGKPQRSKGNNEERKASSSSESDSSLRKENSGEKVGSENNSSGKYESLSGKLGFKNRKKAMESIRIVEETRYIHSAEGKNHLHF